MSRLILFIILFYTSICFAAPNPTSVSDSTPDDGQTISIYSSGSDFGSHDLHFEWNGDEIEAGTDGASYQTTYWDYQDSTNAEDAVYDDDGQVHSGSKSILTHMNDVGAEKYDSAFFYDHYAKFSEYLDDVYVSFWCYFHPVTGDSVDELAQWKPWRITNNPNISCDDCFKNITWWTSDFVHTNVNNFKFDAGAYYCSYEMDYYYPVDSWFRIEAHVWEESSFGAGDGGFDIVMLKPGVGKYVIESRSGCTTHDDVDHAHWRYARFGEYWGNIGSTIARDCYVWWDDIYVQNGTCARVELADSTDLSTCNHREIQPINSWSSSEISIDLSQGSLSSGTHYLHVIDDNGDSDYISVTLGAGGGDSTPPTIGSFSPANGAINQATDAGFQCVISDTAGVDREDIAITIEGTVHCWDDKSGDCDGGSGVKDLTDSGSSTAYTMTWSNSSTWSNGREINITVYAEDTSNNSAQETVSYTVISTSDTTPPYTDDYEPEKSETDVSPSTNIVVHVKDAGDGVDNGSIAMTVKGSGVSPNITGTSADYTLTYDPPTNFNWGEVINVTVDADDLASTPNSMDQDTYEFTIMSNPSPKKTLGTICSGGISK